MKRPILITLIFLFLTNGLSAQTDSTRSAWARLEVDQGDSVYIMSLRPVRIMSKRKFKDFTEQRQYYLYKRAAKKVYPYAIQALEIYADINEETDGMKKRKRKKYIKNEHKELKEDFEAKMKKLSKTEGKVLIKMIERELDKPFYSVIKETRGGVTAAYWNGLGKMWGYDLKTPYTKGADPLLDEILIDYDFGHPDWWDY
jgi:uncharacterized membrane protein YkoI